MRRILTKTTIVIAVLGLLAAAVFFAAATPVKKAQAEAETAQEYQDIRTTAADNGQYDFFTNTREKIIDGKAVLIENFATTQYAKNAELTKHMEGSWQDVFSASGDDPIVEYVPKDLFRTVNENGEPLLYVGKQYGFLVDSFTTKDSRGVTQPGVHSIVMLFSIEYVSDIFESKSHLQYKVTQVFQSEYIYYAATEAQGLGVMPSRPIYLPNEICSDEIFRTIDCVSFSNVPADGIVVPMPSTDQYGNHADFRQLPHYFITGADIGLSLLNENRANVVDTPYYFAENDRGMIFSQFQYSYQGRFLKNGDTEFNDQADAYVAAAASFSIDNLLKIGKVYEESLGIVDGYFSMASELIGLYKICNTAWNLLEKMAELDYSLSPRFETVRTPEFSYVPLHNSHALQLLYDGFLHKEAIMSMGKCESGDIVMGIGDYITIDAQVNIADPLVNTRVLSALGIRAKRLQSNSISTANHLYGTTAGAAVGGQGFYTEKIGILDDKLDKTKVEYSTLETGSESRLFVLNNGEAWTTVTTDKNGLHEIVGPQGETGIVMELYERNANGGEEDFVLIANGGVEGDRNIIRERLNDGKVYYLKTKLSDRQRYGSYLLSCNFTPPNAVIGDNTAAIASQRKEYFKFVPDETGLFHAEMSGTNMALLLHVEEIETGNIKNVIVSTENMNMFLEKDTAYYFVFTNYGIQDAECTFMLGKCQNLTEVSTMPQTINRQAIYSYTPVRNGLYTFTASAGCFIETGVYDGTLTKIHAGGIGDSLSSTVFLREGQRYYFEVKTLQNSTAVSLTVDFTPQITGGEKVDVTDIEDYNFVRFIPNVTSCYEIEAVGAAVSVYDANFDAVAIDDVFTKGQSYYVCVTGYNGTNYAALKFRTVCDELMHNRTYTGSVRSTNLLSFTPTVSGRYKVEGLNFYGLYDLAFTSNYYDPSGFVDLKAGKEYLLEFSGGNVWGDIQIYFYPTEIGTGNSIIVRDVTYRTYALSDADRVHFLAQGINGQVALEVYDADLNLLDAGVDNIFVDLAAGRYFVKVCLDNVMDTLLEVNAESAITATQAYFEGNAVSFLLNAGEQRVFEYEYCQNQSKTRYYISTNEAFRENIDISIYYYVNGQLNMVDVVKTGELGKYYCDLFRDHGTYFIKVSSYHYKSMTFDLFVPGFVQDALVDGHSLNNMINSLYLGLGQAYEFSAVLNDDATYGAVVRLGSTIDGISIQDGYLTIADNANLLGKVIELYFETVDGHHYRAFNFEIVKAHTATPYISGNTLGLKIVDLWGSEVYNFTSYTSVSYTYSADGNYRSLGTVKSLTQDLTYMVNVTNPTLYATITYSNGTQDTVSIEYNEQTYNINETFNVAGKTRMVFDAKNTVSAVNNTVTIPSNIKFVIFYGSASRTYTNFAINVASRTSALTIHLINFKYTASSGSNGLYMGSNYALNLHLSGNNSIQAGANASAINCASLYVDGNKQHIIIGETTSAYGILTVTGGNDSNSGISQYFAGHGIYASNRVELRNATVTARGGNGYSYSLYTAYGSVYHGGHGGNGIATSAFYVDAVNLTATGGTGGRGARGASGGGGSEGSHHISKTTSITAGGSGDNGVRGGNGGAGGHGISITASGTVYSSTISAQGGTGGYGGIGGNGGTGGTGGTDKYRYDNTLAKAGGTGGTGGAGGAGGSGGSGGTGIYSTGSTANFYYSAITATGGGGGNSGNGGNGGTGGTGGEGGHGNHQTMQWGNQRHGATGGAGGTGGRGGTRGSVGVGGYSYTSCSNNSPSGAATLIAGNVGANGYDGAGGYGGRGGNGGWNNGAGNPGAGGAGGAGGLNGSGTIQASGGAAGAKGDEVSNSKVGVAPYVNYSTGY